MAMTLTPRQKAYLGSGWVRQVYDYTASGAGDTAVVAVPGGYIMATNVFDANHNQVISTPPTFGAWSISGGVSTSTLTANAGGVVTLGTLVLDYAAA